MFCPMKTAIIYLFTGTGNTRIAGDLIAGQLAKHNTRTTIYELKQPFENIPDPNQFDMVGFGYPVHAFNTPRFFLDFVKKLPDTNKKTAFVFKTSGEPFALNNASSRPLIRLLEKKGFVPVSDRHMLMPYNIIFRYPDAMVKQMYLHTGKMAMLSVNDILKGNHKKFRFSPLTVISLYVFRLQWLGAKINGPWIHVDKNLCAGCSLCVKMCPAANITMENGFPKFSSHCTMCMRCAFFCPSDAVRPGFLNGWRVNGPYQFENIVKDDSIPTSFVQKDTKGYFRLFKNYYERTNKEIKELEKSKQKAC